MSQPQSLKRKPPEDSTPQAKRFHQDTVIEKVKEWALATKSKYEETFERLKMEHKHQDNDKCQELYMPFFKEMCKIVVGHDDIPVPDRKAIYLAWTYNDFDLLIEDIEAEDKKRKVNLEKSAQWVNKLTDVTKEAWKTDYIGETHLLLRTAIDIARKDPAFRLEYGNFFPIIQGSGTGKSRAVDKLSELVFTIPTILRDLHDKTGYPKADVLHVGSVVTFLSVYDDCSAFDLQRKQLLFLLKCLEYARDWIIKKKRVTRKPKDLIIQWRALLEDRNERKKLHEYAVSSTPMPLFEDIKTAPDDILKDRVTEYAKAVVGLLRPAGKAEGVESQDGEKIRLGPYILFYFDEAHNLTNSLRTTEIDGSRSRTAYQCLCKALGYFSGGPIFTLFLSTYSRLSEFSPSARHFWSYRGQKKDSTDALHAPFVELPFDVWTNPVLVMENEHKISEICSLKFMARFGRPLFWAMMEHTEPSSVMHVAMEKLTLERENLKPLKEIFGYDIRDPDLLPLLALRVDLTFESNRNEAVYLDGLLVASSMRTVYSVPDHQQYLRGGYPSEPFLAEAASRVLYQHMYRRTLEKLKKANTSPSLESSLPILESFYKESLPNTINMWLSSGLVSKGDRGELVARLLLMLAHDLAVIRKATSGKDSLLPPEEMSFSKPISVVEFLKALISPDYINLVLNARPQNMEGKTLKKVFKNTFVSFTHFAKGGDNFVVTDDAAMATFARIAAIQGHATLDILDLVVPVCLWNEKLSRWIMSLLAIQIKNRLRKQPIHIDVEEKFHFFSDRHGHPDSRPYITIAMELGVLSPETLPKAVSVTVSGGRRFNKSREARKVKIDNHPRYEIRITGCSPSVYNVVANKVDYSLLLAHTHLFSEHPRQKKKFLDAVKRMKPTLERSSFDFLGVKTQSRLHATLDPSIAEEPGEMVVIGEIGDDRVEVGQHGDDGENGDNQPEGEDEER